MAGGEPAGGADGEIRSRPVMMWGFGPGDAAVVRRDVAAEARRQGLTGGGCHDFVLAVYEGMANAVRHGGGYGRVRLWRAGGLLCCEISDDGPGIPARCLDRSRMPGHEGVGGRGLWLIAQLSDKVSVETGEKGTVLRIAKIAS
ncbi:ATP-binding protein [Nonomuraea turkmeniaca]|uniref:ATP-binding protein n=1 Tax=Nonomuraea turkmeniaca TaxID=103838 RepID=A0A5S4FI77_9ACTN|nr:ATP-binding protein [Nonomuraea turkmeniaca]TMR19936.1 ATP-binding protein [Nonomuraea turkmeniaca]